MRPPKPGPRSTLLSVTVVAVTTGALLLAPPPAGADHATPGGGAARGERGRRGPSTHDRRGQPRAEGGTHRGLQPKRSTAHAEPSAPVMDARSAYTLAA
ncbi:hypothetical protein [Streptomyces ipomoeae]|uniref:hypothetical protein n=1 Tax=Streptomyces ipomoeae TaxID=103232 RepID=UPI0029BD03E4|nr:hypothetical protein [Streptomyces ipomoeae]MDX2874664.1 hypothetical protein [Streptomyces ipomoeae]